MTAFSSDWERSDWIHQGYKTNKNEVPANDKNPKKYCVRICQLSHFFQRRGCSGILHCWIESLVFLLTSSRIKIKIPPSLSFFPILLVCFSLGSKFIFIGNCFEISETDCVLNWGQRYESEHDPHSWMKNLSSWKRAWKIQVWSSVEPWPLRWPDLTHNDLSPVGLVSSVDN